MGVMKIQYTCKTFKIQTNTPSFSFQQNFFYERQAKMTVS